MHQLPDEIKQIYLTVLILGLLIVTAIILIVFYTNKRHTHILQENKIKELSVEKQQLEMELQLQKALLAERERISRDIHDNIGAGISALKLQAEFLKQKLGDDPLVNVDIDELLTTSEDMNFSMREMMGNLQREQDTVESFATQAVHYVKTFLYKLPVKFEHALQIENNTACITGVARRELLFCIKEAINNMYKHSQASVVVMDISQNAAVLIIDIKDNGIGIQPGISSGNGLQNMQLRTRNIGGVFEILPSQTGAHLRYSVPLQP